MLRPFLLHEYYNPTRNVCDANSRFGLVDVLSSGSLRPHGVDLEVGLVDVDVDILHFREHGDSRCGGMNATRGFGIGYSLDTMHARFELELGEDAATADL